MEALGSTTRCAKPDRLSRFKLTLVAGMKDQFVPQGQLAPAVPAGRERDRARRSRLDGQADIDRRPRLQGAQGAAAPGDTDSQGTAGRRRGEPRGPHPDQPRAGGGRVSATFTTCSARPPRPAPGPPPPCPGLTGNSGWPCSTTSATPRRPSCCPATSSSATAMPPAVPGRCTSHTATRDRPVGAGDIVTAVQHLKELEPQVADDPESQGILAGRSAPVAPEARLVRAPAGGPLQLYKTAFQTARSTNDTGQVIYNGINAAAYLCFAGGLEGTTRCWPAEVIAAASPSPADYWADASRAERHLLPPRV